MTSRSPIRTTAIVETMLIAAALGLASCGSGATDPAAKSSGKTIKVGIAYDVGGKGDKSFNDAAATGLERAKTELHIEIKDLSAEKGESNEARYARLKRFCDEGYNPIIAVGSTYAGDATAGPIARAVRDCPNSRFAIVDDSSVTASNLTNLVFAEEQGSFLVGAAAALKARTDQIGFIGGCVLPVIRKFQAGYEAGARSIKPATKINVNYLSTTSESCSGFNDPMKAKTVATGMYASGVDIIFPAAGGSAIGVFEAAKAAGKWAIGVDSDQYNTAPTELRDVILTSMVKRIDVAIFRCIQQFATGTLKGGIMEFGLKTDGVDFATSGGKIDDVLPQLNDLKQQLIDGKIQAPTEPKTSADPKTSAQPKASA